MENAKVMYTMQNDKGDWGFVQRIVNDKIYDDVQECTYVLHENEKECYFEITKNEYDFVVNLWIMYYEDENEEYLDIMNKFKNCMMKKYNQE